MKRGVHKWILVSGLFALAFAEPVDLPAKKDAEPKAINELARVKATGTTEEETWPEYLQWMADVKKTTDEFKDYINSFSKSISKENEKILYLDFGEPTEKKGVKFYIYKKEF